MIYTANMIEKNKFIKIPCEPRLILRRDAIASVLIENFSLCVCYGSGVRCCFPLDPHLFDQQSEDAVLDFILALLNGEESEQMENKISQEFSVYEKVCHMFGTSRFGKNKIYAIKNLRDGIPGLSLVDAKTLVEMPFENVREKQINGKLPRFGHVIP
jgi:hypothetical protein